jgi:phenol 2-monooxygenase
VERGIIAESLQYDENLEGDPNAYPITVQLRTLDDDEANLTGSPGSGDGPTMVHNGLDRSNLLPDDWDDLIQRSRSHQAKVEIVKAKYLIGCDGAHSWTRKQLNIPLEGSSTDHVWLVTEIISSKAEAKSSCRGVMDIISVTDFRKYSHNSSFYADNLSADIRRISTVTNVSGIMLVIPRERHLVRLYVPLHVVNTATGGQFDRSAITLDMIRKRVQNILSPYSFDFQICDWWTAYRVAQRIAPIFSKGSRMFLAGDAVHTHSPKVGLGMNISMQDGFNIDWKIGLVAAGTAHPSVLDTYSPERHQLATMLLEFDRHWSKSFTDDKFPAAGTSEKTKSMIQVVEMFEDFADGLKVFYGASLLVWKNDGKDGPAVAHRLIPGERFPPAKLRNQAEGRTEWTTRLLESDGRFHVVLLAGDVRVEAQRQRVERLSYFLAGQDSCLTRYASIPGRFHCLIRLVTFHSASWREAEFFQFPDVLRPLDPVMGWDYSRIWCDDVCIWDRECDGQTYAKWVADRTRGAVVVVRPDQYIGWVGELEDVDALTRYFDGLILKQ